MPIQTKFSASMPASGSALPASRYSFDELANIYNQARVDYIVPMPMNGKRMAEYVRNYDISLDASFVSLNDDGLETGVGMLGLRDDRSWITRLGVIPERRGSRIGQFLMENLLEESSQQRVNRVQLEVIVGNEPAINLFRKLGFEEYRELLVIRRPPGELEEDPLADQVGITELDEQDIPHYLMQRTGDFSWIDENPSLLNAGNLRGYQVELPSGDTSWVIFQRTPFQLTHFALDTNSSPEALRFALYFIHREFPMQDTKIENLPVDSPYWEVFGDLGYFEVFRRVEMFLYFNS